MVEWRWSSGRSSWRVVGAWSSLPEDLEVWLVSSLDIHLIRFAYAFSNRRHRLTLPCETSDLAQSPLLRFSGGSSRLKALPRFTVAWLPLSPLLPFRYERKFFLFVDDFLKRPKKKKDFFIMIDLMFSFLFSFCDYLCFVFYFFTFIFDGIVHRLSCFFGFWLNLFFFLFFKDLFELWK